MLLLKVMFYKHLIYLVKFYQKKAKQAAPSTNMKKAVSTPSPSKKKGPKDKLYRKIYEKLVGFLQLYTDALKRDQPGLCKLLA